MALPENPFDASEFSHNLGKLPPEERVSYLRKVARAGFLRCPSCIVQTPQLNLEPCTGCIESDGAFGHPSSTTN